MQLLPPVRGHTPLLVLCSSVSVCVCLCAPHQAGMCRCSRLGDLDTQLSAAFSFTSKCPFPGKGRRPACAQLPDRVGDAQGEGEYVPPWSPVLRPCGGVRAGAQRLALAVGTCGRSRQVDTMAGVWDLEGAPETLCDALAEGCAALPTATPENGALSDSTEGSARPTSPTVPFIELNSTEVRGRSRENKGSKAGEAGQSLHDPGVGSLFYVAQRSRTQVALPLQWCGPCSCRARPLC